jgi:LmbE family N-acetylglucosaminyl deacetylase
MRWLDVRHCWLAILFYVRTLSALTSGTGLLALLAVMLTAATATAAGHASLDGLPAIDATTSLLVVSPHPDDETLCCAGVMQRVLARGGRVGVVWITSGDASRVATLVVEKSPITLRKKARDLGSRRMREARAATSLLGVPSARQLFLGYPDGGILELLTEPPLKLARGKLTGETHVPYSDTLFPGHPYTGESLERDFTAALDRIHPTLILAPSPQDTHPDHSASGMLVIRVLTRRGELSKSHYWIVHGGEGWPSPRVYMPSIPLTPPATGAGLAWSAFTLTDKEEARKHEAVLAYQTQMQVMSPFLLAFVRTTELYSPIPTPSNTTSSK